MRKLSIFVLVAGIGIAAYWFLGQAKDVPQAAVETAAPSGASTEMVAVSLPDLSAEAGRGQGYFGAVCAACHGPNAGGLDGKGPPLVHRLYVPGHHSDQAIVMAARRGVQSHHWRFGNMPVITGLTDGDLREIIAFLREVQRANGIS